MITFIHCADIHLDSPLRGLIRHAEAPVAEIRAASRRAFENLIELCIRERADFLIIAGDLYDGPMRGGSGDFNSVLYFAGQMTRLQKAGIPVFLVRGNHDPADWSGKGTPLPDSVHEFSANRPETVTLENLGVALHGQSYGKKAVTDNLAATYPAPRPGLFNIGILHTALDGREGHDRYAPCTEGELAAKGYDYWALGHVHLWERLTVERTPILFPGTVQGRHIRETGAKGCALVRVDESGAVDIRQVPLDVLRWADLTIDATDAIDEEQVLDRLQTVLERALPAADGRLLAVRLTFTGRCPAHEALVRTPAAFRQAAELLAWNIGEGTIWVERVNTDTRTATPLPRTGGEKNDALAILAEIRAEWNADEKRLDDLLESFKPLRKFLPATLQEGTDAVAPGDRRWLRQALQRAEALAMARLRDPGDG